MFYRDFEASLQKVSENWVPRTEVKKDGDTTVEDGRSGVWQRYPTLSRALIRNQYGAVLVLYRGCSRNITASK